MSNVIVVVDVANLSHRNWHSAKMMSKHYDATNAPIIYGLLRDLGNLSRILDSRNFVFCFDGKDPIRKYHYPLYKADREVTPEKKSIDRGIESLRLEVLPGLGYKNICHHPQFEADDWIAFVVKSCADTKYIIVSNDSDLYQLLSPNVAIWNPQTKFQMNATWLFTNYRIFPKEWALYKALTGCKTDNIEGVPKVGHVTARSYIRGEMTAGKMQDHIESFQEKVSEYQKLTTLPFALLGCPKFEFKPDEILEEDWNRTVDKYKLQNLYGKIPT